MTQILSSGYGDVLVPLALLGLWPIILVTIIATMRVMMVANGNADPTQFKSGVEHGPDRYWRLNRAHLNMQENLGTFALIFLAAILAGYDAGNLATLTWIILGTRVIQSAAQIASGEGMMVNLRFAAYLAQLVCLLIIIYGVITG